MSTNYKYTNEITADAAGNKTSSIGPNDVVLLNGKNIVHSIERGDVYDGINPIPSFDFVRGISATMSSDIAEIRENYFKLSDDNIVNGSNTFNGKQTFISADIENLSAGRLSTDFSTVFNIKSGKISSLHEDDEIATINDIYQMVDNIIVEAGLKDKIGSYKNLYNETLDRLVSHYIKGIIRNKQAELSSDPTVSGFFRNNNPTPYECVVVLQTMAGLLDITPYSLDDKIRSIEKSIDILDVNTQHDIIELSNKINDNTLSISNVDQKITDASCIVQLTSNAATSVITELTQSAGKIALNAKQLLSSDVGGLSSFVDGKISDVKTDVASSYLPLSGGSITGALSANSFSVRESVKNIKVGNSDLCTLLDNEFTGLSTGIKNNIANSSDFQYDNNKNAILLSIGDKHLSIDTRCFTEAKMLDSVHIDTATGEPVLWLDFKTQSGIEKVSVPLTSITRLYSKGDGIDIQLNDGTYKISANDSICRRIDISALNYTNRFNDEKTRIITKLEQKNGLISYTVEQLSTSNVIGLEGYNSLTQFTGSLSGNNGVISTLSNTVNDKFNALSIDTQDFASDDGKIKVLTALSQNAGKISCGIRTLAYTEISGLSDAIDSKLDSTGDQAFDGNLSVAKSLEIAGGKDKSDGKCGATVIGRNAVAMDEESFVWNGNAESYEYSSHGQHTFNVNPQNGIGGFYIGDKALSSTLSTLSVDTVNTANIQLLTTINKALDDAGITTKKQSEITFENVTACLFNLNKIIATFLENSTTTDKEQIFHFTALEDAGATVALFKDDYAPEVSLEYKLNSGEWTAWDHSGVSLQKNDMMYIRATSSNERFADDMFIHRFLLTGGKVAAGGSIQYLLKKDGNIDSVPDYCFWYLFSGCNNLVTAPELPATTLADNCYTNMFHDCTSLATAPELPATTLANGCYYRMFQGCTSLATAPELPATTLAGYCYYSMFQGCTSLATAPELPATTLDSSCYYRMFQGCTSLATAPELPATTLAGYCYYSMFQGCTSLTAAPELPATTLASSCYNGMFQGCTSLATAPELPATTLDSSCYYSMFQGCNSISAVHMSASMEGVYASTQHGDIGKPVIYDL